MRNDQLETMLNEWWQSTKTERWLLGNAKEVINRVLPEYAKAPSNNIVFKLSVFGFSEDLLIVALTPDESFVLIPPEELKGRLVKQLGNGNETP